ncbi:replication protein A 14 kDa subunit-like [Apostichopus japonicus]|uniref:replication protein A 14 kDa subunit-like n=1 Tax=Stichopus japonicus TaxID=307972 RepID=UPI003AB68919
MDSSAKPRINGALLSNYKGQVVCALGKLKVDNGSSFSMTLCDGTDVEVFLDKKPEKELEGMIEVVGEVGSNHHQIQALVHRILGDVEFDVNLYNEAVNLSHQFPEFYKVGISDADSQSQDTMDA